MDNALLDAVLCAFAEFQAALLQAGLLRGLVTVGEMQHYMVNPKRISLFDRVGFAETLLQWGLAPEGIMDTAQWTELRTALLGHGSNFALTYPSPALLRHMFLVRKPLIVLKPEIWRRAACQALAERDHALAGELLACRGLATTPAFSHEATAALLQYFLGGGASAVRYGADRTALYHSLSDLRCLYLPYALHMRGFSEEYGLSDMDDRELAPYRVYDLAEARELMTATPDVDLYDADLLRCHYYNPFLVQAFGEELARRANSLAPWYRLGDDLLEAMVGNLDALLRWQNASRIRRFPLPDTGVILPQIISAVLRHHPLPERYAEALCAWWLACPEGRGTEGVLRSLLLLGGHQADIHLRTHLTC